MSKMCIFSYGSQNSMHMIYSPMYTRIQIIAEVGLRHWNILVIGVLEQIAIVV